ncbi:MAG: SDR family NAD(P)-dependent oxidoreductase [Chloroherpetonaceae bacterium]|nr:SDR family NAD(P)-dependent oxidoreductase [Chthonomonadaceae bacterium]MDW8208129.1 SDR family NAD(P)-dependent oxidoreductase [Chloroherpetonaceae bacterium]
MNVLITGASSGIGEATARLFAQKGDRVAIISEQERDLHRVAEAIHAERGEAIAIVADFSHPEQVEGLIARVEEATGPLDVLVNNAGIGLGAPIVESRPEQMRLLFEVNFFALVSLCQQALAVMGPRRRGHIINVSSAAGRFGSPGVGIYSATKGAVHAFTQALRIEASVYPVFVSEVLPISVRTRFFNNVQGKTYQPSGVVLTSDAVARSIVRCTRSARPPAEVLPYPPVRLAFVLDALFPGLMARLATLKYRRDHRQ